MGQEIKNKIVVLEPCTKTVEELLKTISDRKQAELIRVSIPEEAVQLVRQFQPCMLVVCIQENGELPQRVNLFKSLESSIKYGLLKTLFVSKVKNKQIGNLITSLGVTDFMEEPVPLRTLQFKSNLQLKAVETIRKQQDIKKASQEKIVFKKNGQKEVVDGSEDPQAKPTPALQLDEDSFLFKNSGVKKVGRKMVVELEGPDPASGEWVSHEDKGSAQAAWRWVPEEEKESPEAKRGDGWVHSGDKPQFQEASQKWQMASEKPELAYHKDGKKVAKKISVNAAGEVTVAADSAKAEANIKKAKASAKKAKERKAEQKLQAEEAGKDAKETTKKTAIEEPEKIRSEETEINSAGKEEASSRDPHSREENITTGKSQENEKAETEEANAPVVDLTKRREQKEAKRAKGPALSPLEFLKKKKEKLAQVIGAVEETQPDPRGEQAATEEEIPAAEKPRAPGTENSEEAKAEKKKNRGEALERMRAKLGDGLKEDAEEIESTDSPFAELAAEDEPESRETPAEENGEEIQVDESGHTLIGEKKSKKSRAPALPELVGLSPKERKKKVLAQVQEMLAEPLPKELSPEEEKRLREKFDLEEAPDVTPEALARRERLEKVKALKEGLLEWENRDAEEKAAEAKTHDLSAEEDENTWSRKGDSQKKSVSRRAFDSDLSEEEPAEGDRPSVEKQGKRKKKEEADDSYFYLPEIELTPIGNAWERAEEHQVYLSGEIRYRGFSKLQDLLPLWVYEGEQKPELLDKTKQWRFQASLPFLAKTLKEVPADVREFLLGLKNEAEELVGDAEDEAAQAAEDEEELIGEVDEETDPAEAEAVAEASKSKRREREPSDLFESFEKEVKAEAETAEAIGTPERPVTQADTLEGIFEKKKKGATLTEAMSDTVNSPGIERFLERRKKKEKAEPSAIAPKTEPTNPYLGILVSLSNSFGPAKDSQRALNRVLKSIEISFGSCAGAILGPQESDGLCSLWAGAAGSGERLAPTGARPIRRSGEGEILGYLLLTPTEDRRGYTDREEEMIQKVIDSIWPVLARGAERKVA